MNRHCLNECGKKGKCQEGGEGAPGGKNKGEGPGKGLGKGANGSRAVGGLAVEGGKRRGEEKIKWGPRETVKTEKGSHPRGVRGELCEGTIRKKAKRLLRTFIQKKPRNRESLL